MSFLTPDQTRTALQALDSWSAISACTATLGSDTPIDQKGKPAWLTVVNAGSLAAICHADGLPPEVTEQFYYALLQGADVLYLKGYVTEIDLNNLCQSLNGLRSSAGQLQYFYDPANGPLILDITRKDASKPVIGHGSTIESVTYSPDGQTILTTSKDETAKLWDAASGRELFTLRGRFGTLINASYGPDGKIILATDAMVQVRLWDTQTGHERLSFPGERASFSPDVKSVAAIEKFSDQPRMVKVIDVQSGQESLRVPGSQFAYSADGKSICTGNGTVIIWDLQTGQQNLTLPIQSTPNWLDIVYSPDGGSVKG